MLLVGRQEGHPACKNWAVGCWRGYLSGSRCRLAYGLADTTATHSLVSLKSRLVLSFSYRLTRVVLDKPGVCVCVCVPVDRTVVCWHVLHWFKLWSALQFSASEVTTLWRYTNLFIIVIITMNYDCLQNESLPRNQPLKRRINLMFCTCFYCAAVGTRVNEELAACACLSRSVWCC